MGQGSRHLAIALGVVLAAGAAERVAQAQEGSRGLEEVVVKAARSTEPAAALPNRVTLIDREDLAEQLAISTSTLDAVGTRVPSFSPTRQKLSGFGESMRGREPLYMIDGVPQSNPLRNGSRDGFTLDPAVIERVEVLYGANAIQGIGATGGIVNYITRSAASGEGTRYEVGATVAGSGESDGNGFRTSITTIRQWDDVDLVASIAAERRGAFYDAAGRRIGVDNVQGDIQDSESLNLFAKLGWQLGDRTRAELMLNDFELDGDGDYVPLPGDRSLGIPTSSERGSFEGDPPVNDVQTASFSVSHELAAGSVDAQLYFQDFTAVFGGGRFAIFQDPELDPSGQLFDQSANNSEKRGVKVAYTGEDLLAPGFGVTAGLDYLEDKTFQELIHTGRLWVPETQFRSLAPFVQARQALAGDRLHLSAGVRREMMALEADTFVTLAGAGGQTVQGGSPEFDENLVNVGVSFDATDAVTVYASFAEGFTVPDVGRVLRAVATPGADVDTLLNLEPIVADNVEAGLKWSTARWSGDIAYFQSESDFGQRLQADVDGIFSVMRERTEIDGVELAVAFAVSDALGIGFNYARIDGVYDADGDGSVDTDLSGVNVSPDRLNAYAEWSPHDRLNLRVQSSTFLDRRFDDAGTETDFDGYSVVDAVVGWELEGRGRLDFAVQNLLDEQFVTYYSQSATFGLDDYFAGRGRTMTVRWTGSF
ncbi:MAG TPA: TonB-dependent receptor [Gammaproteobacteria bacterium]